jgi:hypothetical protein
MSVLLILLLILLMIISSQLDLTSSLQKSKSYFIGSEEIKKTKNLLLNMVLKLMMMSGEKLIL